MAGKHQIFSSKKSTRQKANRSWRRASRMSLRIDKAMKPKEVNPTRNKRKNKPDESIKYEDSGFNNPLTIS